MNQFWATTFRDNLVDFVMQISLISAVENNRHSRWSIVQGLLSDSMQNI